MLFRQKRPVQQHNISISGGTKDIKYLVSGKYDRQEGMQRAFPDVFNRYNLRSKIDFRINKWATLSNNSSFFSSKYTSLGDDSIDKTLAYSSRHALACFPMQNPDGSWLYATPYIDYKVGNGRHIMLNEGTHRNVDRTSDFSNTTRLVITPFKTLSITGDFTYRFYQARNTSRSSEMWYRQYPDSELESYNTGAGENQLDEDITTRHFYSTNVYASYDETFGDAHHLSATAGLNYEQFVRKAVSAWGRDLSSIDLDDLNLVGQNEDGETETGVGGGQAEYRLLGFFGRINYDYKGRYLFEVSGRYDGTSRFKRGHRWGFFPSFSLGWRISEEPFFEGIREKFNNFKIRYSYGQLGNQNVGYYDYIRKISIGNQNYLFGGDKPTTATISAPVASNLSWETSIHNNLGVDMSFLNNRLAFSADFYIRDTKDMLTSGVALPSVYGADSPKMNSADLRTKGYELSLSWRDEFQLLRRPFTYSVTVTFNDYVTNITKYANPDRTFAKSYYEGMRWGEIWGYRIGGLFATDAEAAGYAVDQTAVNNRINAAAGSERGLHAGDLKFLDLDGDNIISIGKNTVDDPGDREIIGNSQPRFHYGTTLSMSWAGIDFSIFFQGIGRRHWYPKANTIAFWGPYARPYASWIPKDFHKMYWSEENPDAYFPRPRGYVALSGTNRELTAVNDRYMQNIRYCRLKNLTIGYTLPKKWTRKVLIENLRVYFTGENLATWSPIHSDYIDPEMAAMNDEMRTYPWQKTYMFGVDVTF